MTSSANAAYIAIELSNTLWLVGTRLPGADKARMHRLAAGDVTGLLTLLATLRARAAAKLVRRLLPHAASKQAGMGSGCIGF